MNLTLLCKADKPFREYRKGVTLAQTIERRHAYYARQHSEELSPAHSESARRAIACLNDFTARLVSDELISHTTVRHDGRDLIKRPTQDVLWEIFKGLPQPRPAQLSTLEQAVVDLMTETGREKRAALQEAAITYEIAYRAAQGRFMIFNTLTVDWRHLRTVFRPSSTAFKNYIRAVDRMSAVASHGSVRKAKNEDHHTYFAVVEEGGQSGRLHIHVLHFLKNLPRKALDPNRAIEVPTRRELAILKPLWAYGFSAPIMVRFSPLDAFGKAGYRWPYDTRTEKPLQVKSPLALAGYMSKYITKGYTSPKRRKYLWRIRKSQKLGQKLLQELVSPLTPAELISLAENPSLNVKLNNKLIPSEMIRLAALNQYANYQHTSKEAKSVMELGRYITPQPSPLHSLRASAAAGPTSNQPNTTSTKTPDTKKTAISEKALDSIRASAKSIRDAYFRTSTTPGGTTTIRDYIHTTFRTDAPSGASQRADHGNAQHAPQSGRGTDKHANTGTSPRMVRLPRHGTKS